MSGRPADPHLHPGQRPAAGDVAALVDAQRLAGPQAGHPQGRLGEPVARPDRPRHAEALLEGQDGAPPHRLAAVGREAERREVEPSRDRRAAWRAGRRNRARRGRWRGPRPLSAARAAGCGWRAARGGRAPRSRPGRARSGSGRGRARAAPSSPGRPRADPEPSRAWRRARRAPGAAVRPRPAPRPQVPEVGCRKAMPSLSSGAGGSWAGASVAFRRTSAGARQRSPVRPRPRPAPRPVRSPPRRPGPGRAGPARRGGRRPPAVLRARRRRAPPPGAAGRRRRG